MAREGSTEMIPVGLNVLVVDDDLTCLGILKRLLGVLNYIVTIATESVLALQILRENKGKFDIVIIDVHMPKMNGHDLLECIRQEWDIPVIMLSANDDPRLVMKGVRYGAVDYLLKPVRLGDLKNIWQHVVRRQLNRQKNKDVQQPILMVEAESAIPEETQTKKRKENEDGNEDERESESIDLASKKPRVMWFPYLHEKFVAAVDLLGPEKAFPKKILEIMSVEGISRENVASHLQKYRLYLKKKKSSARPLFGPYSKMLTQTRTGTSYEGGLSQTAMNLGIKLSQKQNVGQFQNQLPSLNLQNPVVGTPTLMDYSRKMDSWSQGNLLSSNPIGADISLLETVLAGTSLNPPPANLGGPNATMIEGQGSPSAQNFDYDFNIEPQRWYDPTIGSSNQTFGVESSAQFDNNIDPSYSDDIFYQNDRGGSGVLRT